MIRLWIYHTKKGLLIALDSCQAHYQVLLIIYLKDLTDKCTDCKSCLDYMTTKDDQLIFRCFECKKSYKKDFDKELIKRFANTYEFCNKDISKFILLLRKDTYPYEYIDSWERFDETSWPTHMNIYIVRKDLMKLHGLIKKPFMVV